MLESFAIALDAVMPFFCYLLVGYLVVRFHWSDRAFLERLNGLIFKVIFPFMMFWNVYHATPESMPSAALIITSVSAILLLIGLLIFLVPRFVPEKNRGGVVIQGIFRSNFVLFGVTLTVSVFGEENASVAGVMVLIIVAMFNVAAVLVLEMFRDEKKTSPGELLLKLLKNPLLQGCILGLVFFLLGIHLPHFLEVPVSALAACATPMAVITLGGTLTLKALKRNMRIISWVMLLKLILIPIVMMTLSYLIGLRGVELFLILMIFGTPIATSSYPMAANMGGDGELAGQLVVVSTIVSLLTLFCFIFFLSQAGLQV
ncbi:MAG: AEC family transporter [Clostridia bacterium]|nr:AEC family transporter [Clostridia bacterium]